MKTLRQEIMHKLSIIVGDRCKEGRMPEDFDIEADAIIHLVHMATGTPAAELSSLPVQS